MTDVELDLRPGRRKIWPPPGIDWTYCDDAVALVHSDWRLLRKLLPVVDHTMTDPPYDRRTHAGTEIEVRPNSTPVPFAPVDVSEVLSDVVRLTRRWIVAFCSMELLGEYSRLSGNSWVRSGFWHRTNGPPQFSGDRPAQPGEGIAIMHRPGRRRWNSGGHHAFWAHPVARNKVHPTQKPLDLMAALIRDFTDEGELILDPYAGSGTTLVAAAMAGRRAIGIEIDYGHCQTAIRRLKQVGDG